MMAILDAAGLLMLAAFYMWSARNNSALERVALALAKTCPVALLIFNFGPQGGTLLLAPIAAFAAALDEMQSSSTGRAHLVAGLCAGLLFASGPFGSVFVGGALLTFILAARTTLLGARMVQTGLLLFVPLVVIGGYSIAAQAQTGDLFALTCRGAHSLSRLSRWLPQWPAPLVAGALMPCLAPNAFARLRQGAGSGALVVLGGAAAALITFGSTIDGIVESVLAASVIANAAPVVRLKSVGFAFLVLGGVCALLLCYVTAPTGIGLARPSSTLWQIGKRAMDTPPAWGIDHAR